MSASTVSAGNLSSMKRRSLPAADSLAWLYGLLALLGVLHLTMVFGRGVNWDEFWFYSQVQTMARGEFIQPLQTIHTRFFAPWLPHMPGSVVEHIVIARLFMALCLGAIAVGIYYVAESFSDKRTALLAVAIYLGAGFVLHHGTSFRVDPIVTALLTTGLAIAARTRLSMPAIIGLGAVIGLAGMVTIKFVLWVPAFAGIALWRWQDEDWNWQYPLRWIGAGAVALIVFGAIYWLHSQGAGEQASASAGGTLSRSANKMFGLMHSPYIFMMAKGAITAIPFVIAALMVPSTVLRMDQSVWGKVALSGLWLPLLTPLFYHNSAPYVYTFLLPPVTVTCALTLPALVKRYGTPLVVAFVAFSSLAVWIVDDREAAVRQKQLIAAVHETFPEPVHYFDCCGMIGSFPKANEFLTSYGIEKYLMTGQPDMLNIMREVPVPLVIDNNENFSPLLDGGDGSLFHPDDAAALADTYVPFWGDLYVAGKIVAANQTESWNVLVPGPYTLSNAMVIDDQSFEAGGVVELERGEIAIENTGGSDGRLLWGNNLTAPDSEPPEQYWAGF